MQRRAFTLLIAGLAFAAGSACAQIQIAKGKDYVMVDPAQPTEGGGKVEVIEFFWYGCGHCFKFEPTLVKWTQGLPKDVVFKRVPAVPNDAWAQTAVIYYTLEAMGLLEKMHQKVFDAIHLDNVIITNRKVRDEWLAKNGVDPIKFTEVEKSFAVQSKLARAKQLTASYKIDGVPMMVVNGKYLTSLGHAGGPDRLLQVIDGLVAQSRKETVAQK
jgi:protein dithiol oxidoreductase (disulfide-forming)